MNLEGIILSEVRQKQILKCFHFYVESKKMKQRNRCN